MPGGIAGQLKQYENVCTGLAGSGEGKQYTNALVLCLKGVQCLTR